MNLPDYSKGMDWISKAANQEYKPAQEFLQNLHEERKNYLLKIKSWLDPNKAANSNNRLWLSFYDEAIEIAQQVEGGTVLPFVADKMIEDKRLALNKAMVAAKPNIVNLNCSLEFYNPILNINQHRDEAITIDYTNSTVNGIQATFSDTLISWQAQGKSYSGETRLYHFSINRLSGFYNTDGGWSGHCAPAQRQF